MRSHRHNLIESIITLIGLGFGSCTNIAFGLTDLAMQHRRLNTRSCLTLTLFIHKLGITITSSGIFVLGWTQWRKLWTVHNLSDKCMRIGIAVPFDLVRTSKSGVTIIIAALCSLHIGKIFPILRIRRSIDLIRGSGNRQC
ncbi:hypothetical protein ACHAW5_002198 [Stephanodiscus triporus]|uniref:Uncharacterized protein n=1 Tax=Stephanodiscus triporus TaxID=2934178 RepID=A0ABD3MWU7_9STRA